MTIADRHITIAEAETLFGVPRRTLYRWVTRGHLQPIRADRSAGRKGRLNFFQLSEVAATVADRGMRASR